MSDAEKSRKDIRIGVRLSPFYTLEEVKDITTLSRSNLFKMIEDGKFPRQIKIADRRIAWSKSDVNNWIDKTMAVGYRVRMKIELDDLLAKTGKLRAFIKTDKYFELGDDSQKLLQDQMAAMEKYATILFERMARAGE